MYHCPGDAQPIDRAIHLGRLATFYAACRDCPHRHDTGTLPPALVKELTIHWRDEPLAVRFTATGVESGERGPFTATEVRQLALAYGQVLRAESDTPRVVLSGDGRPFLPELIAAAAEGLRWAGCNVLDIGAASAGCTAWSIARLAADGGFALGNPTPQPQRVGLKFWSAAEPWRSPGHLEQLQRTFALGLPRPTRSAGRLDRVAIEAEYLATLSDYFHALRPLRFVLDSTCRPLVRALRQLTTQAGCRVFYVQDHPHASHSPALPRSRGRENLLAEHVRQQQAHFGIWTDGNGEALELCDETGARVIPESLVELLAPFDGEGSTDPDALRTLAQLLTALSQRDFTLSEALTPR